MRRAALASPKLKENLDFRARFGHKRSVGALRMDSESAPHAQPS